MSINLAMVQKLDIKRGHFKNIEGDLLRNIMEKHLDSVRQEGGWLLGEYGAMRPIKVKVLDKKTLLVDITTAKDVDEETALASIKVKNKLLYELTGFTAKQRSERLQKKAKEGKL